MARSSDQLHCIACGGLREARHRFMVKSFLIYQCLSCRLSFVHPIPEEEEIKKIYEQDYFRRGNKYTTENAKQVKNNLLKNEQNRLNSICGHTSGKNLLDVGCATGSFMMAAKNQGYVVQGIDVAESAEELTPKELSDKITYGDILKIDLPADTYDVITLWDVIEHVRDPAKVLAHIVKSLKPEGTLFLSTGDSRSVWARITGKYWQLMTPPQHLYFFNQKSIKLLMESVGLKVRKISYPGKYASLEFILFKSRESFGKIMRPFQWFAQKTGIERLNLYLNLFDQMTCVGQKEKN